MRKSYQLLQKLFDMIVDVNNRAPLESNGAATKVDDLSDSDDDFVDATEDITELANPLPTTMDNKYISANGKPETIPLNQDFIDLRPSSSSTTPTPVSYTYTPTIDRRASTAPSSSFYDIPSPPQSEMTFTDQIVYAGTLMALGAIMLLISLLPPTLSRILSIIGFRGSRSQALLMLWKVSSQPNPFGGLATFVLGSYYGIIVQNSDIIAEEFTVRGKDVGTTLQKLHLAVLEVRKRYPESALWAVEEVNQRRKS